jgi:hypothetical protein
LGGGAELEHGVTPASAPAICCGPNVVNFSKVVSLNEMIHHIYGRLSVLAGSDRPNMFINELRIYIDYLKGELLKTSQGFLDNTPKYYQEFKANLLEGVAYYREMAGAFVEEHAARFRVHLEELCTEITGIEVESPAEVAGD